MFRIEEVQEVGCCSDVECSGVRYGDKVFVIVDTMTEEPIDLEDYNIRGLYQEGEYRGMIGSRSSYRDMVEEAMQELIAFFS